jgi:hypothetical protein
MAGLPWFELDTDFHESPKVRALASRLREPLADAYVARLYAYCYRHARDRFDPEVAAETLEEAARWRGRRGVLFDALFAVGVLEREAGKVVVHGVAERLAPHLAKRIGDAERQQRRRDKLMMSGKKTRDVTGGVTRDVTRESQRDKDKDRDREEKEAATAPADAVEAPPSEPYPWPKAAAFRQTLTDRMARTVLYPVGGPEARILASLEASLEHVPASDAVELCRGRIVAASAQADGRVPGTLSYFAQVLADEAMKRQVRAESTKRKPNPIGIDPVTGAVLYAEAT